MDWLNNILNDERLMKNIKTGIIIALPFLLAGIYWGYVDQFKWENWHWKAIGVLTVIFVVSLYNLRVDIKIRAKDDEIEQNEELNKIEDEINAIPFEVRHDHYGLEFVNKLNETTQNKANLIKTEKQIHKIQVNMRRLIAKGKEKEALRLQKDIDYLKQNPLIDKNVVPIKYSDLISNNNHKSNKDLLDAKTLNFDPSKEGNKRSLVLTTIKGVGSGGVGLGFAWSVSWSTVIGYAIVLILSMLFTIVTQYPMTRYRTKTKFLRNRKRKLKLLQDMKEYINIRAQEETETINNSLEEVESVKTQNKSIA